MICVCSVCSTAWGEGYVSWIFLRGRLRCFADLELSVLLQQGVLQRRRCDEPPERASSYLQGSQNCLCERVRATIHTLHDPFYLLECIYGLVEIGERRVCWQVASQYLVLQRTHRGAVWASGAAQAAHVVRIIFAFLR